MINTLQSLDYPKSKLVQTKNEQLPLELPELIDNQTVKCSEKSEGKLGYQWRKPKKALNPKKFEGNTLKILKAANGIALPFDRIWERNKKYLNIGEAKHSNETSNKDKYSARVRKYDFLTFFRRKNEKGIWKVWIVLKPSLQQPRDESYQDRRKNFENSLSRPPVTSVTYGNNTKDLLLNTPPSKPSIPTLTSFRRRGYSATALLKKRFQSQLGFLPKFLASKESLDALASSIADKYRHCYQYRRDREVSDGLLDVYYRVLLNFHQWQSQSLAPDVICIRMALAQMLHLKAMLWADFKATFTRPYFEAVDAKEKKIERQKAYAKWMEHAENDGIKGYWQRHVEWQEEQEARIAAIPREEIEKLERKRKEREERRAKEEAERKSQMEKKTKENWAKINQKELEILQGMKDRGVDPAVMEQLAARMLARAQK